MIASGHFLTKGYTLWRLKPDPLFFQPLIFLKHHPMSYPLLARLLATAVLGTAALSATAQNLAIVNGKPVPLERVELLKQQMEERTGRELPEEMMSQLKEEIITREIFMQEAQRRGLERSASYAQNMDMARQTILIRELFLDFEKTNPITDAEIEAEYQAFAASNGGKEYRASHILVESEAEAKTLIASIKGGKKFADIAKKSSKDPGSGANGGDLGWASPSSYVPEFTEAMVALEKGKMTEQPVQSQFGWHIIRVDDLREAQLPPLEEVKDQIQQQLEQQKMVQFQEELRAKAKVE